MSKSVITSALLATSVFSTALFANNQAAVSNQTTTCQVLAEHCQNAVNLGNTLAPYAGIAKGTLVQGYNMGHDFVQSHIPASVIDQTNPYLNETTARNVIAHGTMGVAIVSALAGVKAVIGFPLWLAKLPFHNRVFTFVLGAVAMQIYSAN